MRYYVYILKSELSGRYYIGQTNNLNARLQRHNKGQVKSTAPYRPWSLMGCKACNSRSEAIKLECSLKASKSRKRIENWLTQNPAI